MSAQNKGMIEKEFVESLIAYQNDICNSFKKRAEAAEAKLAELAELEIEKNETQGCLEMLRDDYKEMSQRAEAAEADSSYMGGSARYWHDEYCSQQHRLVAKVVALEAKLAELEKQEPYAFGSKWTDMKTEGSHFSGSIFNNAWGDYTKPLFTRPAPAVNLAELVPIEKDRNMIAHVYLDATTFDKPDAYVRGFNECRSAMLRNIEEANK